MGGVCFLFGRCEAPQELRAALEQTLGRYVSAGTRIFVLGTWGGFGRTAAAAVGEMKKQHPDIKMLRLEYGDSSCPEPGFDGTLYPEGLEDVPKRFAEAYANRWMVQNCDSVICHVKQAGNPQILLSIARRREIPVENLAGEE